MIGSDEQLICEKIKDFLVISNGKSNEDIKVNKNATYSTLAFFGVSVIRIKCSTKKSYFSTKSSYETLSKYSSSLNAEKIKSDPLWVRIPINSISDIEQLYPLILDLYDEAYEQINTETFSCCSRYVECSDAKMCIHPDKILAKGCFYKKNLEKGRIFYGKNATSAN